MDSGGSRPPDGLIGYPDGLTLSAAELLELAQDRRGWKRMNVILPPGIFAFLWEKEQSGELSSTGAKRLLNLVMEHNEAVLLSALDTLWNL